MVSPRTETPSTCGSNRSLFRFIMLSSISSAASRRSFAAPNSRTSEEVTPPKRRSTQSEAGIELDAILQNNNSGTTSGTIHTPETSNSINSSLSLSELFKLRKTIAYSLCIAMSGFVFGFDIGTIGGLVNFSSFRDKISSNGTFDRITLGALIGVSNLASFFSGWIAHRLTTAYGRKVTLVIAMAVYLCGNFFVIVSQNWVQVLCSRSLNGFAIGISSVCAPMFISELPQPKLRGMMLSSIQLMTTSGIFFGALSLYCCHELSGSIQFQLPLMLSSVIVILAIIAIVLVPESPIFLIQNELHENAADIVANLNDLNRNHWYVRKRVREMSKTVQTHKPDSDEKRLKTAKLKFRYLVGICIMVFQQLTGINYFFFYGTSIFGSAGISDPYVTSIIMASVNLVFSSVSLIISDRFNRKTILICGSTSMFCCMMIFASVGSFAINRPEAGSIMIGATCWFIASFSMSWGPISFMIVGELFPYQQKTIGMSIASSANWITTFLVSFFTPFITQFIGFRYGFFFAGCLFCSAFFVYGFVPETRRRAIEDIEEMYSKGIHAFWVYPWELYTSTHTDPTNPFS